MVSVAAVGGALTMHSSPMLGQVRESESTECGRCGLFRWEYDYHSLFNTTLMKHTKEEDAQHDSDAERERDYDDDDDEVILRVSKLCTNQLNHVKCKLYKRGFSNTSSSWANRMQQYLL